MEGGREGGIEGWRDRSRDGVMEGGMSRTFYFHSSPLGSIFNLPAQPCLVYHLVPSKIPSKPNLNYLRIQSKQYVLEQYQFLDSNITQYPVQLQIEYLAIYSSVFCAVLRRVHNYRLNPWTFQGACGYPAVLIPDKF